HAHRLEMHQVLPRLAQLPMPRSPPDAQPSAGSASQAWRPPRRSPGLEPPPGLVAVTEHGGPRATWGGSVFEKDELTAYRKLVRREDPFGLLQARSLRSQLFRSEGE